MTIAKTLVEVVSSFDTGSQPEPFAAKLPQTVPAAWTGVWNLDFNCANYEACPHSGAPKWKSATSCASVSCTMLGGAVNDMTTNVPSGTVTCWPGRMRTSGSTSFNPVARYSRSPANFVTPPPDPENPTTTTYVTGFVWPDEVVDQPSPEQVPIHRPMPGTRPVWPPQPALPGEQPSLPDEHAKPGRPYAVPVPVTLPGPVTYVPWPADNWLPVPDDVVVRMPAPGTVLPGYARPGRRVEDSSDTSGSTGNGRAVVSTDGRGSVTTAPGSAAQKVPEKGTVQRKVTVAAVAPLTWAVMNFATEAFDFVDAMHGALDERCKRRKIADGTRKVFNPVTGWRDKKKFRDLTPYEQTEDLIRCAGTLDLASAIENYVNMQLTDMFFGMLDSWAPRYYAATGQLTGLGRGLNQGMRYANLADQNEAFDSGDNWREYNEGLNDNPVPQFDFDPEKGEIGVTWFQFSFVWDLAKNKFRER